MTFSYKNGILTLYQNDDYIRELIDLYTSIEMQQYNINESLKYIQKYIQNYQLNKYNNNECLKYIQEHIQNYHYINNIQNIEIFINEYIDIKKFINNILIKINEFMYLIIEDIITITISIIEFYTIMKYKYKKLYNNSFEIIGVGSRNIVIKINNIVLKISIFPSYYENYIYNYNYVELLMLKYMYNTNAANNLPIIEYSSIEILPVNYENYNKSDYIPKWYIERLYIPIKISDIRENKHLLNLYINCVCNIL